MKWGAIIIRIVIVVINSDCFGSSFCFFLVGVLLLLLLLCILEMFSSMTSSRCITVRIMASMVDWPSVDVIGEGLEGSQATVFSAPPGCFLNI